MAVRKPFNQYPANHASKNFRGIGVEAAYAGSEFRLGQPGGGYIGVLVKGLDRGRSAGQDFLFAFHDRMDEPPSLGGLHLGNVKHHGVGKRVADGGVADVVVGQRLVDFAGPFVALGVHFGDDKLTASHAVLSCAGGCLRRAHSDRRWCACLRATGFGTKI